MDLKKSITWGKYESAFYTTVDEEINQKTCYLLGYRDGIPVLSNKSKSEASKPPTVAINKLPTKQTLKVETDSVTGEKYINLNGKKLKMVAEPQLTTQFKKNSQVMQAIPGTNGSKKPMKIKIIGSIPSVLQTTGVLLRKDALITDTHDSNSNVNKTDNNSKITPIVTNTTLVKIPSTDKAVIGGSTALAKSSVHQTGDSPAQVNGRSVKTLIYTDSLLKMNPLDLSKVSKPDCAKVEVRKVDSGVQTRVETVDKGVQVDEEEDFFSDILNINFLDLLSSNVPLAPVAEKVMTPKVPVPVCNPVQPANAHTDRFKMFFFDLRNAMVPDMDGNRPIHVGVLNNDLSFVKRSCSVLKALQTSVDVPNHGDLTALQLAILNDSDPAIVKTLLTHGASLETVDAEGNNILHLAIEWKRTEVLDTLLRFADERKFNLNDFNAEGLTPLMMCCCNKLVKCADLLLKFDADVNVKDRKSGRTALFHAAEAYDFEMVQLLLSFNADTKIKNFFGTSPHDAMYEVDDIPEDIKRVILGKTAKRKTVEEPKVLKIRKVEENASKLKTYARFKKISDFEIPRGIATKAK